MARDIPMAGVVGQPVAHSKSPILFRHWLQTYGIQGQYIPLPVAVEHFDQVISALPRAGFVGVNVTIPHKISALKIADKTTDRAIMAGAANTLIFRRDGLIHADNTDGYGFIANMYAKAPTWDPKSGPAAVLGAGGAARAVVASLLEVGCAEVILSNRTRGKAEALRADFGAKVTVADWLEAGDAVEDATTVVNTTSLGMLNQPELRVPLDGLQPSDVVCDLVYAPLRTRLLQTAQTIGCTTVDGLGMLLHQAVPGFERWFGRRPDVTEETRMAVLS